MIAVCLWAQVGMLMEKGIVLAYLNMTEPDHGELQPAVLRLPDGAEGHLGLLPDLPGEEEARVGVSRAAKAKSYAPLPTPRAPTVRSTAQTSAGQRAQPVAADLQRRDGLPRAEEELSAGGGWSEVSGETW